MLAGLVCVAAGYVGWRYIDTRAPLQPMAAPAPVHVAMVERRDVPVVLNGLGTVQATNTVTVRSRVDGQIEKVAFEEGQIVHQGDLLVQIDRAPFQAALDQATAKLAQDQAMLKNAQLNFDRASILAKKGDATQQTLDQQTANVAQLAAQIQGDQAAIESARVQLAYTTISSPLTGRVGFRLVDPGNIVHATDQTGIVTITQLDPISVIFTAPEEQLPAVSGGLKTGPLPVAALSSDGKRVLADGTLALIDNLVDAASGTIRLKASFANANGALWPGLSVSTRLRIDTLKNTVAVPDTAVQRGPSGLFAFVVAPDGKAQLRNLDVGPVQDGWAVVTGGLEPGERIVTSGHYRVEPGKAVAVLDDDGQPPTKKADRS
jgi:multidrug efflux system membrane fusion protein